MGNIQALRANGVHAATRRLTHHLQNDGHVVEVWHFTRAVTAPAERLDEGINVLDLPVHAVRGVTGAYLQIPTREARSILAERALDMDVVHLHSVFQPDHLWAARLGRPYVVTPHGGYDAATMRGAAGLVKQALVAAHERRLLRSARAVQVLSGEERRRVSQLAPGSRLIQLAFPLDLGEHVTDDYAGDGPILFVGRLDVRTKGLDLLLDAVASDAGLLGGRQVLLIGPSVGDSESWLRQRAGALGIADRVCVRRPIQNRKELVQTMSACSVFVHTSRREGLPTAVLEAMHCSVPVLVTEETNTGTLVRTMAAGMVVSADAASIADGLRNLLALSAADRDAMGKRGKKAVLDSFTWDRLRDRYEAMYRGAAQG
ncbi:glycosyltransferase family 4 protein [Blastococcus deserti]|uniref:Glycosyltransferase family 4 protein n=1 Tax=Blastococcus deserti TaxID=2259033 RepID=A0ABW4XDS8_9ACTN